MHFPELASAFLDPRTSDDEARSLILKHRASARVACQAAHAHAHDHGWDEVVELLRREWAFLTAVADRLKVDMRARRQCVRWH